MIPWHGWLIRLLIAGATFVRDKVLIVATLRRLPQCRRRPHLH